MRGTDLRAARTRLGATHQQIAQSTGVRTSDVEAWETLGDVPRKHRFAVDLALWGLECDQTLARSGLPECEQIRRWNEPPWDGSNDEVARHMAACPVCISRDAYVKEHVRPMPAGGNLMLRIIGFAERRPGWVQSASFGALMLLMMGGVGVLVMLGQALLRQDVRYVGYAVGLFALLVVSGAAGGIVHHWTGPLRQKGTFGYYASYILTVDGYLLTVLGIATVVQRFLSDAEAAAELPTLTDPVESAVFLVLGVVFGIALGRAFRDGGTTPAGPPRQRRLFSARKVAIALLFAGGIGLEFLARQVGPSTPEEWEAALPAFQAAVRERPDDPVAQRELAWAFVSLNRWNEARPVLREAVRLNPDDSDLLNSLGWVDMEAGDVEGAIPLFRRAIAVEPANSRAHYNLAWAFYRLGRFAQADSAYRAIVSADPEAPSAHGGLGWVLIATRRLEDAEKEFRAALRVDSSYAGHHRGLAVALMQNGQPQAALASFRTAVRLAPDQAGLWSDIGRLAHITGEFDESAAAFERASQLDPALFDHFPEARAMWDASRRGHAYVPGGR